MAANEPGQPPLPMTRRAFSTRAGHPGRRWRSGRTPTTSSSAAAACSPSGRATAVSSTTSSAPTAPRAPGTRTPTPRRSCAGARTNSARRHGASPASVPARSASSVRRRRAAQLDSRPGRRWRSVIRELRPRSCSATIRGSGTASTPITATRVCSRATGSSPHATRTSTGSTAWRTTGPTRCCCSRPTSRTTSRTSAHSSTTSSQPSRPTSASSSRRCRPTDDAGLDEFRDRVRGRLADLGRPFDIDAAEVFKLIDDL